MRIVLLLVTGCFCYAQNYVVGIQEPMTSSYTSYSSIPTYSPRTIDTITVQQPMPTPYQIPSNKFGGAGIPQASIPITPIETDIDIGPLELARLRPIIRKTS